jgi:hypothetical protein
MVDWDLVDKRRAKGWDWERIAADPKVGFHADESAGDPGRALRALYYQRRSKVKRQSGDAGPAGADSESSGSRTTSPYARIGFILAPMFAIWLVLALLFPSLIGTIGGSTVSVIPYVGLALGVGAFLLGFGLLRSADRWTHQLRVALTLGIVLGIVVAGSVALVGVIAGCPNLSLATTGEPQNWTRSPNAAWTIDGATTFFFFGAVACPYCSASSWAIWYALGQFGQWSGVVPSHSSPTDVYSSTPALDLSSAALQSSYVAPVIAESSNPNTIVVPSVGCPGSAYVGSYDSGGSIPFAVVNGQFIHNGAIVDPGQLRQSPGNPNAPALSYGQMMEEMNNQTGAGWNAVSGPADCIMALVWHADGHAPGAVTGNAGVRSCYNQIR